MKKIIFTALLGLIVSTYSTADTLIPRSVPGDKGKYYLIEKKKQGDVIATLHKRVGVETVDYTRLETNCKTMKKVKKYINDDIDTTSNDVFDTLFGVQINESNYSNKIEFVKKFILERLPVLDVLIRDSIAQDSDTNQLDFAGGWDV